MIGEIIMRIPAGNADVSDSSVIKENEIMFNRIAAVCVGDNIEVVVIPVSCTVAGCPVLARCLREDGIP